MSINLGNNTNVKFRVGSADCKVYLGTNLLYPNSTPSSGGSYLTFIPEEDASFRFSGNSINYSLDSGATWSTLPSETDTPTVQAGHTIMWKAALTPSVGIGRFQQQQNIKFKVLGNPMSLLYGDNFSGQTNLSDKLYAFYQLFYRSSVSDASELLLPATTLSAGCYGSMFMSCISLTAAPALPATTLETQCYIQMFDGCSSLTTAPELPATTLGNQCYDTMFKDCWNLTTGPSVLPATGLTNYCYRYMFMGCRSLKKAPEISGTTFGTNSYDGMFNGCVSMTKGPSILPATTLTSFCYRGLFSGCTSLEVSPILPAERLLGSCYRDMFNGCTNLKRVTCLAIDRSASYCTTNWLLNVAENGTFIKNSAASWGTGVNAVPISWTVQNYTT